VILLRKDAANRCVGHTILFFNGKKKTNAQVAEVNEAKDAYGVVFFGTRERYSARLGVLCKGRMPRYEWLSTTETIAICVMEAAASH
jgi:hypothetical protein